MSEGYLSQDEIDALLQGTGSIGETPSLVDERGPLTDKELKALKNIIQSSLDSQSSNLSMLTGKQVMLGQPSLEIKSRQKLLAELPQEVVQVTVNFTEGITGEHSYLLNTELATRLASFIMGQEKIELNEAALSGLAEAISNISGALATSLGNQIRKNVMLSPANCLKLGKSKAQLPGDENLVINYSLAIEGEKPAVLTELYSLATAKAIAAQAAGEGMAKDKMPAQGKKRESNMSDAKDFDQLGLTGQDQDMLAGLSSGLTPPNVQSVQLPNLQSVPTPQEMGNIGLLMDVYMEMTVELGRTKKLIREILSFGEGTIIELDKLAGEPVDILVNHKLIAKGEVVVIDENFGVRITEIVSPLDRMADLK